MWYSTLWGDAPLELRWVLVRDPKGKLTPKAYFSTDQQQCPIEIVQDFVKRWSIEVTFEESRAHLGIETQRQWSDQAIERSTPALFGLYSLVCLIANGLQKGGQFELEQTAWYKKRQASFSDLMVVVRQALCVLFTNIITS